jgi:hypothetical protein
MSYWGEDPGPTKGPGWHFTNIEMLLVVVSWFALGYVVGTIVR